MKYKHKRICKSIVSLLLIITFVLAPFEGVFASPGGVNGEASTHYPGGVKAGLGSSTPLPLKGLANVCSNRNSNRNSQKMLYNAAYRAYNKFIDKLPKNKRVRNCLYMQ